MNLGGGSALKYGYPWDGGMRVSPTPYIQGAILQELDIPSYKPGSSADIKSLDIEDLNHSFPKIIDNNIPNSTVYAKMNGDGSYISIYKIDGSYRGVDGVFEWIIQNGEIVHRAFIPGGSYLNPLPNQWPNPSVSIPKW